MTEGVLYKKLGMIGFPSVNRHIKEVLDATKAEYPKHEQFELPTTCNDSYGKSIDWEQACKIMEQKNIQREEWFKKHFGAEP